MMSIYLPVFFYLLKKRRALVVSSSYFFLFLSCFGFYSRPSRELSANDNFFPPNLFSSFLVFALSLSQFDRETPYFVSPPPCSLSLSLPLSLSLSLTHFFVPSPCFSFSLSLPNTTSPISRPNSRKPPIMIMSSLSPQKTPQRNSDQKKSCKVFFSSSSSSFLSSFTAALSSRPK